MYVCMYVCMYVYSYTYIYIYMYVCINERGGEQRAKPNESLNAKEICRITINVAWQRS